MTAAEVASELRLARSTVTGYLRTGEIRGGYQTVPGGRWLVDEDAFRAWQVARRAAVDPHRIEPRSSRSKAAQNRRRRSIE